MSRVVNPYSFVPFPQNPPTRVSPETTYGKPAELLHGYMDIELVNKSPLIIPDTGHVQGADGEHKEYRFFRLPDEKKTPAIPGSEIRGLVRSIYETVTGSCTTVLLDHNDYSMRTPPSGAYKKRALLEYDPAARRWRLLQANIHEIYLDERSYFSDLRNRRFVYLGIYHNGQAVWYLEQGGQIRLSETQKEGYRPGWISFNEPVGAPRDGNRFRHYRVVILDKAPGLPLREWEDQEPYRMMDDITNPEKQGKTRTEQKPAARDYREALKKVRQNGGCLPVWYLQVNGQNGKQFYLSNAAIGRVHMNRTWKDVMGAFSPCEQYDALCPACRLFGTAAKDAAFRGRVRFTDAACREWKDEDFGIRTLDILSNPRPSAFEFYIEKPEGDHVQYWNYDYYGTKEGMNLIYRDRTPAEPRGRKFYWHSEPEAKDAEKSKMNATMEYLKAGHVFPFRIYFDGITEDQLSDLQYALTMGDNHSDSDLQMKIGHAKPLGYGSIKLIIQATTLRKNKWLNDHIQTTMERQEGKESYPEPRGADPVTIYSLKAICSVSKTKGQTVAYPQWINRKGEISIFEWFSNNRKAGGGNWSTLPYPTDPDITIEAQNPNGKPGTGAPRNAGVYPPRPSNQRPPQSGPRPPYNGGNTFQRPSAPANGSTTRIPAAPASNTQELKYGSTRNAIVTGNDNAKYVYLEFPRIDSPFCTDKEKGRMLSKPGEIKRYAKGKQLRIKIIRFSSEEKLYIVELSR